MPLSAPLRCPSRCPSRRQGPSRRGCVNAHLDATALIPSSTQFCGHAQTGICGKSRLRIPGRMRNPRLSVQSAVESEITHENSRTIPRVNGIVRKSVIAHGEKNAQSRITVQSTADSEIARESFRTIPCANGDCRKSGLARPSCRGRASYSPEPARPIRPSLRVLFARACASSPAKRPQLRVLLARGRC